MAPATTTTTTTTTGSGGSGGSGGVSPAGQAAVSMYLTTFTNAMAGMACPASPHWVNVPFSPSGGQQTSASNKSPSAVDGANGMSVTCSVQEMSGAFRVSASLKTPATDVMGNPVNPSLVALSTTIAPGQTANGTLTVQDNRTTTPYTSANDMGAADATCEFSLVHTQPTDQLAVAPGRIWAAVKCPRFRDPQSSNLNEICSIGTGYLVLENCAQ
jgi:hypothetical protein